MEIERLMEVYKYADKKAHFLYNEDFRVQWNGKPTKQLRAIISNYCKGDGFKGEEVKMITRRITAVMFELEYKMYH